MSGSDRAAPSLDIRLFGAFEVRRDGAPLPHFRSLKGSRLLALLALRHGGEVERAWIAGTLWPDSPEMAAPFCFHDEFIEWIAAGIWFEQHPEPFSDNSLPVGHPLARLPVAATTDRFVVEGITCQVRTNPKPLEIVLRDAFYCSQPLFEFVLELDGQFTFGWRVEVRERRGKVRSRVRNSSQSAVDGVLTLDQARTLVEPYIREVSDRRRSMRKAEP